MHATDSRKRDDLSAARRWGCREPTAGRLLPKSQMRAVVVVVEDILLQEATQVSLAERHDVVQQFAAATADPPLAKAIMPGASERCPLRLDAHRLGGTDDQVPEDAVAIMEEIARHVVAGKRRCAVAAQPTANWDAGSR